MLVAAMCEVCADYGIAPCPCRRIRGVIVDGECSFGCDESREIPCPCGISPWNELDPLEGIEEVQFPQHDPANPSTVPYRPRWIWTQEEEAAYLAARAAEREQFLASLVNDTVYLVGVWDASNAM